MNKSQEDGNNQRDLTLTIAGVTLSGKYSK
jgi:hypothetical protein